MPNFDRACLACEWATDFSIERSDDIEKPCPQCGSRTVRFMSRAPHMFRDTLSTPLVDSVMDKGTMVFQTRSEHKAAMDARGLKLMDCHVGVPGSDKSPVTQKWESGRASLSEDEMSRAHRLARDAQFQAARREAIAHAAD